MANSYRSPWLDDDLEVLKSSVERFVDAEVVPHDSRWRKQKHVDPEVWSRFGEMGLLLMDVPDTYGGMGGDFRHECVLYEALAKRSISSFGQGIHSICAHYILNYGTEQQKQHYLPRMASGELVGALAMSEPSAGSDLQSIRTRAERRGDRYVVNGSKIFITNGYLAGLIALVVKTAPGEGAKGTSILLVETKDLPGYRVGRILDKIGMHGQDTSELFFEDVEVPAECLLGGDEGQGFYQLMGDLPYERAIVAVAAVASMERAIELATEYARERSVFGQKLIELQNTRFELAEVATIAQVARCFVDRCIEQVAAGTLDTATASMAKYWTTDMQCKVIDRCLQLFGGYGYMDEYEIARLYVDARVQPIYAGSNEIMKEIIARSL